MNKVVIKSIRVKACWEYQSTEIEAEFPDGPCPESIKALQHKALELATEQAELVDNQKKQNNFKRQENNSRYQAKKYNSNPYMQGGNR